MKTEFAASVKKRIQHFAMTALLSAALCTGIGLSTAAAQDIPWAGISGAWCDPTSRDCGLPSSSDIMEMLEQHGVSKCVLQNPANPLPKPLPWPPCPTPKNWPTPWMLVPLPNYGN